MYMYVLILKDVDAGKVYMRVAQMLLNDPLFFQKIKAMQLSIPPVPSRES